MVNTRFQGVYIGHFTNNEDKYKCCNLYLYSIYCNIHNVIYSYHLLKKNIVNALYKYCNSRYGIIGKLSIKAIYFVVGKNNESLKYIIYIISNLHINTYFNYEITILCIK